MVFTGSTGTSTPASSMIAWVNPYHVHSPESVMCTFPSRLPDPREHPRGEIGGESRRQPLVRDHLKRPLLAGPATIRVTKFPPLEALPWSP